MSKNIFKGFLIMLLFIPTVLAIYNIYIISSDVFTVENVTKVEIMASVDGPVLAEYTSAGEIRTYIKTLENANPISTAKLESDPLILKFYKGDRQFIYGVYLSLNTNNCIIMTSEREYLHMKESDAERLLNTEMSDKLYVNNIIPAALIVYGEETAPAYPAGGEWMLRKPDNKFYPSSMPAQTAESNSARAYQNRPFEIRFPVEPDSLFIEVIDNKNIIFSDIFGNFNDNFSRGEMKDFQYVLTAEWREKDTADFYGKATYILDVKYSVPPTFYISHTEAAPGEIVTITAYNLNEQENLTLTADMGYEAPFASIGLNRIALLPIGLDFAGRTFDLTLTSNVNDPIDYYLKINERSSKSVNTGAQDHYVASNLHEAPQNMKRSKYNDIFGVASDSEFNYWRDQFAMPAEGRLLLEYGWKLTVNMGYAQVYNGVMIEVSAGAEIKASNGGRVIFVDEIPFDGNLVVIDHGMGIRTWYGHLGAPEARPGDIVVKGQTIGTGGRSGMATSLGLNYLFFAVSVGNVFVDPLPVVKDGIPGIDSVITDVRAAAADNPPDADIPEAAEYFEEEDIDLDE